MAFDSPSLPPAAATPVVRAAPPPQTATSSGVATLRVLGGALDATVRTVAATPDSASASADRLIALWRSSPLSVELGPNQLQVGGAVSLRAGGAEGRWLLPAFMAGLRTVQLEPEATVDDIVRFAEELSALKTDPDTLATFRDWLWSDGAEGLLVDVQLSFVETFEGTQVSGRLCEAGASVRSLSSQALGERIAATACVDLDQASLREEFDVELDEYARAAAARRLEVDGAALVDLSRRANDAAAWGAAQLEAIIEHDQLQQGMPPSRIARRVMSWLQHDVDVGVLCLIDRLWAARDGLLAEVAEELLREGLGRALAGGLDDTPGEELLDRLSSLAERISAEDRRDLVVGLLRRRVLPALVRLVASLGPVRIVQALRGADLNEDDGAALGQLVRAAPSLLRPLLSDLEQAGAPAVLYGLVATLDNDELHREPALVDRCLQVGRGEPRAELIRRLSEMGGRSVERLIELCDVAPETLEPHEQQLVTRGLLATDGGRAKLVEMVRDRSLDASLRMAALRATTDDPELLEDACRFRVWEMFEPAELRRRIKSHRDRRAAAAAAAAVTGASRA